ncbi:MAG: hypothetical protein Q8N23_04505 [Archangium sp.]|nr:hypothetical protein [Archangium sp.]MDP3151904.1 hypothetical protein [Archangium sp.]MDP3571317.1 hypothetical protein [Archangium sp.]
MKRTTRLVLAGTGAAGLAVMALWPREPAPSPMVAEPEPVAMSAVTPVPEPVPAPSPGCTFSHGAPYAWAVTLEATTRLPVPGSTEMLETGLRLSAQLGVEVVEARADGALLVGRLAQVNATGVGADARLGDAPFMLEVGADCRLRAFGHAPALSRAVARTQQALLWETQFSATPAADFQMENANGLAVGSLSRDAAGTFTRTLTRYERLWAEATAPAPTRSTMLLTRAADGWFDQVQVSETLVLGDARSDSRLSLVAAPSGAVSFTQAERERASYVFEDLLPWRPASQVHRPVSSFDVERRHRVAALTVNEAVEQFIDRTTSGRGIQQTWPELAAWFEVHPEGIAPAIARYDGGDFSAEATRDFFLALGKTRNLEAREALLALKRDPARHPMDRVRSMFALGTRDDVGVPLALELADDAKKHLGKKSKQSRFLGGESLLALSMLSGLSEDAAVQKVAASALAEVLSGHTTYPVLASALAAVGNTGDASLLPSTEPFVRSEDRRTRRAATALFNRMPPEATAAIALEWLRRETDLVVKRDLYDAIQHQHFDQQRRAERVLAEQALLDLPLMNTPMSRRPLVLLIARSAAAQEPAMRQALIAQARVELSQHSSLLKTFQDVLTQDEIAEVLR